MDVESKLQYNPIISFQTRTFDHLSFAHTTAYCKKYRFAPGSDPMEPQHSRLGPMDRTQ